MIYLGLNTKFVLLLISISATAISVLTMISVDMMQQSLKKDASLRLNVIAADRVQTLKNIWDLRLQQVETLASDSQIKDLLNAHTNLDFNGSYNNKNNNLLRQGLIEAFNRLTTDRDGKIYDLKIINVNGFVVFSQDAVQEGKHISQLQAFKDGIISPNYKVEFDAENKRAMLVLAAPIINESGTNSLGVVLVSRDIDSANNIVTDKRFLGDTGEIYLVDQEGRMITDSRFVQDARYNTEVNTVPFSNCFERGGSDINGALYTNYRNTLVFGASQCEKNTGIVLIAELEHSELFQPILTLQSQFGLIAIVIVIGSSAIAFFLSLSILRPLQKLRSVMKRVQEGEFIKTNVARGDEIGDLAKSFNSMVEDIAIRTKRLHLKNDILSFMSSRLEVQAQELIKADSEKERFAAIVTDETKRVLVPIIGYSELLLDGTLGNLEQKQREKIQVIIERAWSQLSLFQNILDARRLESGYLKMDMKCGVPVEGLITECAQKVSPVIESQKHKLISRIETKQTALCCDRQRILQVLDNFVSNAIKFHSVRNTTNAVIELTVFDGGDRQIIFSVKDNGIGISKERQGDLFKKFYRLDSSLTRGQGVSLGLTISKSIVEAHGGKIWVESEGIDGKGSTFLFSIPLPGIEAYSNSVIGGQNRS